VYQTENVYAFLYLVEKPESRSQNTGGVIVNTIYFNSQIGDELRRTRLYDGQLFVFSPCPSSLALCEFARNMIQEEFRPLDPLQAQHSLPVEEYAAILSRLKPNFIHHPESKQFIQGILKESGCDLNKTYFDVPRMRSSTSDQYLTTGIAYAWHPHRDSWYSAPHCQLNWWLPIFEIDSGDGVAFHSRYWNRAIRNDSSRYNYYEWNKEHRPKASQYIKEDPRPLPRPVEPVELDPQIRPICPVGGIILFSGAQLHSTVPNTSGKTRFSIDFRTVHLDDVVAKRGAPNVDSACTGTSLRDFLRATDFSRMPEEIAQVYDNVPPGEGVLIFQPPIPAQ
jgi:hypothetical protein